MKFRYRSALIVFVASVALIWTGIGQTRSAKIPSDLYGRWQASYSKGSSAGADIQYSIRTELLFTINKNNTYSNKETVDNIYYKNDIESDECRYEIHIVERGKFQLSGNIITFYNIKKMSFETGGNKYTCDKLSIKVDKKPVDYRIKKYSQKWRVNRNEKETCLQLGYVDDRYGSSEEYCR